MPSSLVFAVVTRLLGGLVYFGRMLDKIRLHAAGKLPSDYHANLGIGFDARTSAFSASPINRSRRAHWPAVADEEILAWAYQQGVPRSDPDRYQWNRFMTKIGWRDDRSSTLRDRILACGLNNHVNPIETFFDLNDCDEAAIPWPRDPGNSKNPT